jgi:hypothetical protein
VTPRATADGVADDRRKPDAIEVWATRLGRTLGYIFVIGLAAYLIATYWPK